MKEGHVPVNFITPEDVGPRNWGREILCGLIPGVCTLKILMMNAGAKGGLQKHRVKDEIAYLFSGEMMVDYDPGDGTIVRKKFVAGNAVHFPPGAVHREEAITDCIIIEASNPIFNDRVRVEEEYGETIPEGGLPTTTPDQIVRK